MPAVDGNVLRVLARIRLDDGDIMKQSVRSRVEETFWPLCQREDTGAFNQALMELGAIVCVPNGAPLCEKCPVKEECLARKTGTIEAYPVKEKKTRRRIEERTVLLILDGRHVAVRKRPGTGFAGRALRISKHGGTPDGRPGTFLCGRERADALTVSAAGCKAYFSHVEWHMTGYVVKIAEPETAFDKGSGYVVETQEAQEHYPMPAAFVYASYMDLRLGQEKYQDKK